MTEDTTYEQPINDGQQGSDGQPALPEDRNRELFKPLTIVIFIVLAALTVHMFAYPLHRTFLSWGSEHHYNDNGPYIFGGAVLLVFWLRKKLRALPKTINYWGLALVVCALLWSVAFKRGDINAMQTIGFVGLVWALCLYLGGWLVARTMMFPLFLSLFSVQWGLASSVVSLKMRLVSTEFACWFINVTGKPFDIQVLRQGTNVSMVDMPDLAFDVAAACSGLQSLLMTSVLALLMCYLVLRTWWKRLIMLALVAPIAILNNSLRIVLIAYSGTFFTWIEHALGLSEGWGRSVAFGAFHEYPGIFVYTMGFVLVWLTAHYLERLPGIERVDWLRRKAEKKARKEAEAARKAAGEAGAPTADDESAAADGEPVAHEEPKDYSFYGRLWKHALLSCALVLAANRMGEHAKLNITPTVALASTNMMTLVVGKEGFRPQVVPSIVAFPLVLGGRGCVNQAVSQEELKQLPDDTEYFRGLYIPTNVYNACARAVRAMLFTTDPSNDLARTLVDALSPVTDGQMTNAALVAGLTNMAAQLRENLAQAPHMAPLLIDLAMMQISRLARTSDSVLLAIVQNNTDQHSIHPPEACFPAQGWSIDDVKPAQITLGSQTVEVARLDVGFRQEGVQECVVYWYQCEGEGGQRVYATRNYPWLPFKTALDLILRGRSSRWAFVRLSTPVDEGTTYDEAFDRLCAFIKDAEPYLVY